MATFFERLDDLSGTADESGAARWLDRIAFIFVTLMVVTSPHSIAASQTSWLIGLLATLIRLAVTPRRKIRIGAFDIAIWALFGWSVVTAIFSYAPDISYGKLRSVSLFLVIYLVIVNLRNLRAIYFLGFALILSCMVNVVWTPVERIIGRGVEVHGIAPDGPLPRLNVAENDTLLLVDGKKLGSPEALVDRVEQNGTARVVVYKVDYTIEFDLKSSDLLAGSGANERLGFETWKRSHNWRSAGFFGHYTTYAEVLQLIASLAFGFLVALWRRGRSGKDRQTEDGLIMRRLASAPFLIAALGGLCLALLMTVTRASQLAFLISAFSIILVGAGWKWFLRAMLVIIPLAAVGLFVLQQTRQVGFFDSKDNSITWRQTVWHEGYNLWTSKPRNFMLGVGMDSIKRFAPEWHLFDDGRLPMGHFHSTPLQFAVERGLPALLLWIAVLALYARILWRAIRRNKHPDWRTFGILLGCLGALIGFLTSGMVHYNLGDGEVAMVFYLLIGFGIKTAEHSSGELRIET
jgi:hypothetical protein